MAVKFFPFLLVLFFWFAESSEYSEDLATVVNSKVQALVDLADIPESWNEFEKEITNFAIPFSNLDEPNVLKLIYREFSKHPVAFSNKFTSVVSRNFSDCRKDQIRQISDLLIVRSIFLLMQDFSVDKLTERHVELGQRIHNFIFKVKSESRVGARFIGIVLKEFLKHLDPKDIVLFALFECNPISIHRYKKIFIELYDANTDFKYLNSCISSAVQFYDEFFDNKSIILKKIAKFSHEIKCSYTEFVLVPIITLSFGTESFSKLVKTVENHGKLYTFQIIRHFPFQYQLAYFMILDKATVACLPRQMAQKLLEELELLVQEPQMWTHVYIPNEEFESVIKYIRNNYLSLNPLNAVDKILLKNIIFYLAEENQQSLFELLHRTG
jgi:hypothetical protein